MVSGDVLELIEGADTGFVDFHSTLPPRLMCNMSDASACKIHIDVTVQTTTKDARCFQSGLWSNRVPQAMVGFYADYEPGLRVSCGLVVNDSNWYRTLMIPIAATIDRLVDGDQTRQLQVHQSLVVNSVVTSSSVIKTVSVRTQNLDALSYCIGQCTCSKGVRPYGA